MSIPGSQEKILVVDDDPAVLRLFRLNLENEGFDVRTASNFEEFVQQRAFAEPDAILLDVMLPGTNGIEILRGICARADHPPVVMVTASGVVQNAVTALKLGAFDYLVKPEDIRNVPKFVGVMKNALQHGKAQEEIKRLKDELKGRHSFGNIIGESESMNRIFDMVRQVSQGDISVLIQGASGTGKELIARAIHYDSPRSSGPFVTVNCAAIPVTLIESELFGHTKGAFTGAIAQKKGKFEVAHGGSIFLDEIGDMDPSSQAKLLRVLQDHTFERVGGTEPLTANVRVIAATNRELSRLVESNEFRADLYYRINVFPIEMPSLAERREDVPLLAAHFLHRFAESLDRKIDGFTPAVMNVLAEHDWPGNVRELENVVHRAVIAAGQGRIDLVHLPPELAEKGRSRIQAGGVEIEPVAYRNEPTVDGIIPLADVERETIQRAIFATSGNLARAAQGLGIGRATLYRKVKQFDLTVPKS
jgi:DNA-binding NtrC family response regulator